MCEGKQQLGTHTYEYQAACKIVNAYTCIAQEYFLIQVLNVQWVADMISGKIILVLKITGKDTIGVWEYHIILLGKQFSHPLLNFPPTGLWAPSKQHDGGAVVIQTHKYTPSSDIFDPVIHPTTQASHGELGIYSLIIHPGVVARMNDTPGKIAHTWERVEVENKEHRVIHVCGATYTLFGY